MGYTIWSGRNVYGFIKDKVQEFFDSKAEEEEEKKKEEEKGASEAEKERDKILEGAKDTTERKGKSKNYEKGGGDSKAKEDFDSMDLKDVKDIETKYGPGKVGTDSDGNNVIYRPGSSEGPATVEIQLPGGNKIKIRY